MLLPWVIMILGLSAHAAAPGPCDKWFQPPGQAKGVVLLSHGMNLRPDCMDEIAKVLAGEGFEVFRPAFTGHCGANDNYLNVRADQWREDAKRSYEIAAARAKAIHRPLNLFAYSFTALIFQTLKFPFAQKVLIAPPFATKFWYPALVKFASWFPDFTYTSRNPYCAANPSSSARSLLALEDFMKEWRAGEGKADTTPTLAFTDPEDELINYEGLRTFTADKNNWDLEAISNRGTKLPKTYHHLIIDGATIGEGEWNNMKKRFLDFFAKGAL